MNKKLLFLAILLLPAFALKAQTFSVADTVTCTFSSANPTVQCTSVITNSSSGPLTVKWHVVGTTFTPEMLVDTVFGICDNNQCRPNTSGALWNGTSGNTFTTNPYPVGSLGGGITYSPNLTNVAVTGCHNLTVNILDPVSGYNKNTTFVVCRSTLAISNVNGNTETDVILYPNPARDELNVVYDANADVKNVAIYNIIGKVITVFKVAGDSANLNLENIPSGIYFVRLLNSHGAVVTTKRFTKQ